LEQLRKKSPEGREKGGKYNQTMTGRNKNEENLLGGLLTTRVQEPVLSTGKIREKWKKEIEKVSSYIQIWTET